MKKTITLSAISLLVVIAVVTNPKKKEHIDSLTSKAMDRLIKENPQQNDNLLVFTLGNMALSSEIERLVEYNSYVLFSTTSRDEKTISIGLFGNVFTTLAFTEEEKEENLKSTFIYKGKINKKHPITMEINIDKDQINGHFIYDKIGTPIQIKGKLTQDQILLNGFDSNNKLIDIFKGTLKDDEIIGKWSDEKRKKLYDFQLVKQQLEVFEKTEPHQKSILNMVSIKSIKTGFGAFPRGWKPAIQINFENKTNKDISEFIRVKAVFYNTETNTEIGNSSKYLVTKDFPFSAKMNKDILLLPNITYKGSPVSLKLRAKLYIKDEFIEDIAIEPIELY